MIVIPTDMSNNPLVRVSSYTREFRDNSLEDCPQVSVFSAVNKWDWENTNRYGLEIVVLVG